MRRIRSFPGNHRVDDNPLVELYGSRLLVNGQLWKGLKPTEVEELAVSFPILNIISEKIKEAKRTYRAARKARFHRISTDDDLDCDSDDEVEEGKHLALNQELEVAYVNDDKDDEDEEWDDDLDCDDDEDDDEEDSFPEHVGPLLHKLEMLNSTNFGVEDALKKAIKELDKSVDGSHRWPKIFKKNLLLVAESFGLNALETEMLSFFCYIKADEDLRSVVNIVDYGRNTLGLLSEAASFATGLDEQKVRQALAEEGRLMRSGLFKLGEYDFYSRRNRDAEDCFEIMFEEQLFLFFTKTIEKTDLYEKFLKISKEGTLSLADFDHIPEIKTHLLPTLKNALKTKKLGSNFLLYGASGTGKTELTRTIASKLKMRLFSVGNDDDDRLASLQAADNILAKTEDTLIVVDECDDIFNSGFGLFFEPMRKNKGEIVDTLENNSRPTFWTCNSIEMMDDAMLRRFDLIIKMPELQPEQREKIVRKKLGPGFTEAFIKGISKNEAVSFAMLDRALSIARGLGHKAQSEKEADIVKVLNQTLRAQKARRISLMEEQEKPYDLSCANTTGDLRELSEGLKRHGRANICLYGAPGTGKSAYARWLAEELHKPIIIKRASDLLGPYVGMTEANIANAFQEAEEKQAILVIDEADSFFRDRKFSEHSWEVTQVNEMLTQMETQRGIFIATTNLMDDIDEASLRRFDLKLEFKWLNNEQRVRLLNLYGQKMGIKGEPNEEALRQLRELDSLSPGDFGNLLGRNRFSPIKSYSEFVARLGDEQRMKRSANKHGPIGFN